MNIQESIVEMNFQTIVVNLLLLSFVVPFSLSEAQRNSEPEVTDLLNRFFLSAREYSVTELSTLLSRKQLEENIRSIALPGPEEVVLRSSRQIFSLEFSFGGDCRIYVDSINQQDQWTIVRLLTEQEKYEYANKYEFYLVKEVDKLRIDHTIYVGESDMPDFPPQIDICEVPINWDNPSLLKPGETIQEQRIRLGIP